MNQTAEKNLTFLGNRTAFNKTLRHLVNVTSLIDSVDRGQNLAELLNKLIADGVLKGEQISPILSVVLVSKFECPFVSRNLEESVSKFDNVVSTFTKWSAVNMVVAYHHPNLGVTAINPANANHWEEMHEIKKDELVVVFARTKNKRSETAQKAIAAFFDLLAGKTPAEDPDFIDLTRKVEPPKPTVIPPLPTANVAAQPAAPGAPAAPAAAPAPAPKPAMPTGAGRNLTPKYSVQVTNELFHNGNVEAWKNIVESYETAHPGNKVIVYHEGELIQDLNSLFKWGKVKHGGVIMFQVAGTTIKNVSRLQKYLFEGASKRFEAFMKHDVNKVLPLF